MLQLKLVAFCVVVSGSIVLLTYVTSFAYNNADINEADPSGHSLHLRQQRENLKGIYNNQPKNREYSISLLSTRKRRASNDLSIKPLEPFSCSKISCSFPPDDVTCKIADKLDDSINHPKGQKAACCPLYKCTNKDGSYFPFHGVFGRGPSKAAQNKMNESSLNVLKSSGGNNGGSFSCSSITCQFPPVDASCNIVNASDTTISHPKGEKATCCPLYKCINSDGSIFPFHGAFGRGPNKKEGSSNGSTLSKTTSAPAIKEETYSCTRVNCAHAPTSEAKCSMLDPNDNTLTRPKGKHSTCCPLFRCENVDGSVFSFHGVFGKGPTIPPKIKMAEVATSTQSSAVGGSDLCSGVHCNFPPLDSDCKVANSSDTSVQSPKGKTASCCPLYKCINNDGSFFPFHGIHGKGPTKPPPTSGKQEDNFSCSEIHCQFPPNDAKCTLHDKSDNSIQQPKGKKAICCPLYKCVNEDESYFPFHGAFGRGPAKGGKVLSTTTTRPPPITTPFSSMMMFTFPTFDFGMNMMNGESSKTTPFTTTTKPTQISSSFGTKGTTTPRSLFVEPEFPKMDFLSMDFGMNMNFGSDSSTATTTTPSITTTVKSNYLTTTTPVYSLKTTTSASFIKEVNFPSMDFPSMDFSMSGFGDFAPKSSITPRPAIQTIPSSTTPSSKFTEPTFPSMDFPSMDFSMAGFGDSSQKSPTTQSPANKVTPTPTTPSSKIAEYTFPSMDFPLMDFSMSGFGDFAPKSSITPSPAIQTIPSSTTPSSKFTEPTFPSMDFPSMDFSMAGFGDSSQKSAITSNPAIQSTTTPSSKFTEPTFPSMDFPSMDFSMAGFGDSSQKSTSTPNPTIQATPSPTTPSSKIAEPTFPSMDFPSMDFSMMGMDMKMPSMEFPIMTGMTPSSNQTGDNGNVTVIKSVDTSNGNVETNVVATGGQDAVAFATDGGGEASEADLAAMQKEMDAMTASMNNMMMKKR